MAGQKAVNPHGVIGELKDTLRELMREHAESLAANFAGVFDRSVRDLVIGGLEKAQADEGTIWVIDESQEFLVPVYNSGPWASEFVGKFRQSLRAGMISMVIATEQPICENGVQQNKGQDRTLDNRLGLETCAMIAVPFRFGGEMRGVVSAVQLRKAGDDLPPPPGFSWDDLQTLLRTGTLLGRLVEHKLLTRMLGLELSL
jgi:hypothetical protein